MLAILYVSFRFAASLVERTNLARRAWTAAAIVWLAVLTPAVAGAAAIRSNLETRSYLDVYPGRLAAVIGPGRSSALTEAGRLPYWVRSPTFDIIGLNDAHTAREPADLRYVEDIAPDFVMFNVGYTFDLDSVLGDGRRFARIDTDVFGRYVEPSYRHLFEAGSDWSSEVITSTDAASVVLARYLADHAQEYEVVLVHYRNTGVHVHGIRKALPEAARVLAALESSTNGDDYTSYAALKGFFGARPFKTEVDPMLAKQ